MKRIFVTATDTGAGKTRFATLLVRWLRSQGHRPFPLKPAETGCRTDGAMFVPDDAMLLAQAAGLPDRLDDICPFRYANPLAPAAAARIEGNAVEMARIASICDSAERDGFTHLIVEGAGGLLVPLSDSMMMADLPRLLVLDVILVARLGLGTINHTLLSLAELSRRGAKVTGIVLNDTTGAQGIAEQTNPAELARLTDVPILGTIPYGFEDGERLGEVVETRMID